MKVVNNYTYTGWFSCSENPAFWSWLWQVIAIQLYNLEIARWQSILRGVVLKVISGAFSDTFVMKQGEAV